MRRYLWLWFFLSLLVLGTACSKGDVANSPAQNDVSLPAGDDEAEEAEGAAAVPPTTEPTPLPPTDEPTAEEEELAEEEATPLPPTEEPTAVPPTVPPTEAPTATAAVAVEVAAGADEVGVDVPDMVWLPYSSGTYGNPVLTVQNGEIAYEEEPAAIEAFFDYANGRIAYGAEFWYAAANGVDAVTDLWVYDYVTEESELWLDGNVGRADWSPGAADTLAVALHNGSGFDLALVTGPEYWTIINKDIEPFYSWSPSGEEIAFVRDGHLIVTTLDGSESEPIAAGLYEESGWVGDAPLWLPEEDLIAYADFPVTFASLDGVEQYEPIGVNGEVMDVTRRPFNMLWSGEQRQLLMQYEGMFGSAVQIFQFAEDIYTVTDVYDLGEGTQLADWLQKDESVIILKDGEPQIYSLTMHDFVSP
jgi:hypothetical protein